MLKPKKIFLIIIFQILIKNKEIIPVVNSISKLISIFPKELKDKFLTKNYQIYLLSHKIYNNEKRNDKLIFYCKDDDNIFYIGLEVKISSEFFENKNSIKSFLFSENLSKLLDFFDLKLNDLNFIDSSDNYTEDYLDYIKQDLTNTQIQNPILKKFKNFSQTQNFDKTESSIQINQDENFPQINKYTRNNNKIHSELNKPQNSYFEPQSKYLNSNIKIKKKKVFNRNNTEEMEIMDALKEIKNISLKNNYDSFVSIQPSNQEEVHAEEEDKKSKSKFNDYFLSFLH